VIVTLTQPLWVGKYEVTQQQYEAVMGTNPSHFKKTGADAAFFPVEKVSHVDVQRFCKAVSEATGGAFRLLSEAEWEYAYRAGTRTRYYNGDSNDRAVDIAQCNENNFISTAKVGSKLPNNFGLFDLGGNVAEWCADNYQKDFVDTQTVDPRGAGKGTIYVNRGNAWDSYARTCNATARMANAETYAGCQIGFRLARVATVNASEKKLTHIYQGGYGSPEVDHTRPTVTAAEVAPDGLRVRLRVTGLVQGHVHDFHLPNFKARDGEPLLHDRAYYTLNEIPKP
jgi:formylglycine-generating enzyme required for sulfatase activity